MSKRGGGGGRRKVGHKGGHKRFSNRDEILSQQDDIRRIKENEGEEDGGSDARKLDAKNESGDSSSSEDEKPVVGVGGLIEVENPNWIKKEHKKVTELDTSLEPSRREREALEKEKARLHYEKLHAAGKTEQAQADLARLAIIRREREEAAAKRQVEADAKKKEEDARKARETEKRQQLESKGGVPVGRKGKR